MPYEEDVIRHYANYYMSLIDSDIRVYLAYNDNKPVGYLVAYVKPYLFNRGVSVGQEMLYVVPDSRGGKAAIALMKKLDDLAKENNALEVYAGVANGYNAEKALKFFERLGYEKVGSYVRKVA